jgi:DNA-binding ferritin-like protein
MDETKILPQLLCILDQIKMHHWATMSYASHKALDELHGKLSGLVDTFVESYLGRYQKQPIKHFTANLKIHSETTPATVMECLKETHDYFTKLQNVVKGSGELINILEEMRGSIDQTMYLVKLT